MTNNLPIIIVFLTISGCSDKPNSYAIKGKLSPCLHAAIESEIDSKIAPSKTFKPNGDLEIYRTGRNGLFRDTRLHTVIEYGERKESIHVLRIKNMEKGNSPVHMSLFIFADLSHGTNIPQLRNSIENVAVPELIIHETVTNEPTKRIVLPLLNNQHQSLMFPRNHPVFEKIISAPESNGKTMKYLVEKDLNTSNSQNRTIISVTVKGTTSKFDLVFSISPP